MKRIHYFLLTVAILTTCTTKAQAQTKERIDYYEGSYYEGEIENGKPHEEGCSFYKNQKEYEGEWQEGRKEGHGISYNGFGEKVFEGEWRADEPYDGVKYENGVAIKYSAHNK